MNKIIVFLFFISLPVAVKAQVEHLVCDSLTGEYLPYATVTVMRAGKSVSFLTANASGRFVLKSGMGASLKVIYLGYRKKTFPIDVKVLKLAPSDFKLREVTVQGGRISARPDTVTYDLSRFATERDNSLNDVLKRLPGVDVDKDGTVKYKGKAISRFTVEGMDLTGGRYNRLTDALKAKDMAKAEMIEHDQPIKALQGKLFSDDVAMNIRLKPSAKGQWGVTVKPVFSAEPCRVGGCAEALMIGSKNQSFYSGEYDRTGKDLSVSDRLLALGGNVSYRGGVESPTWFDMPTLETPIDGERLRFNRSHNWSAKTLCKLKNGNECRLTAGYFHSDVHQSIINTSLYYLNEGLPIRTDEANNSTMRDDRILCDMNLNMNREKSYSNAHLMVQGSRAEGISDFGSTHQYVKVPELKICNTFSRMISSERYTWSLHSDVDFHHRPSRLSVDDISRSLSLTHVYTDENAELLLTRKLLTHKYTIGATYENLNVITSNARMSLYLSPYWEYHRAVLNVRLSLPMEWQRFMRQGKSFCNISPMLSTSHEVGSHSVWHTRTGFSQKEGDWTDFAIDSIRQNYRSVLYTDGIIPQTRTLYANLWFDYKRPVYELFWSYGVDWTRLWRNIATDMTIADGQYQYRVMAHRNQSNTLHVSSKLSKGFFSLHLKTRLDLNFSYTDGKQLSQGEDYDYSGSTMTASPQIIFAPNWGEFTYSATYSLNRMKTEGMEQVSLFLMKSRLAYTQTIGKFDVTVSAVHYHNELQSGRTVNALLTDASLILRLKHIRLQADLRNLCNKHTYEETTYQGIGVFTNTYTLRPREFVISAQISL